MRDVRAKLHQLAEYTSSSTFPQPSKSMDHAQAVLAGTEAPTVEDFIEWHEEQACRMGELGFTMGSYCAQDFLKQWSHMDDLEQPFSLENCAQEAMERMHADVTRLQQRLFIMRSNQPLLALTEIEVQRRLLQAEPNHELYAKSNTSLRKKIARLHKLEHPTEPREPNGVEAWLYVGPKLERKIKINLPIKASLSEVCRLLEGIKRVEMPFLEDSSTGTWLTDAESVWKYHLVHQGKFLKNKSSVKLLTDEDYRKMIAQIIEQRQGITAAVAVLTLVGTESKNLSLQQLTFLRHILHDNQNRRACARKLRR